MKMFQALKMGVDGKPKFISVTENIYSHVTKPEKSWFLTLYKYNSEQVDEFKKSGKLKGIRGAVTDQLFFDFDSVEDLTKAQTNTAIFIQKLLDDGFPENSLQIYYSGGKGFSIHIDLNEFITHEQFVNIIKKFHKQYGLDPKIIGPNQIMRVPNTRHDESKRFKIPLELDEILTLSIDEIKELANNPRHLDIKFIRADLPHSWKILSFSDSIVQKRVVSLTPTEIDWVNKPKDWRNCKWALLQGDFKSGQRNWACMILAATCKGLGFDQNTALYMCKSALHRSWEKHGEGSFTEEELENNVIKTVYDLAWKGGQYSCKNDLELQTYCEGLGDHQCKNDSNLNPTINIEEAAGIFKDYAKNIDKLTIKTGIKPLDKNLRMTIGMTIGIVAGPGVGKTSLSLQILNTMSKADELCLFLSYDMYHALVYQKLAQKHTGKTDDVIFNNFKTDNDEFERELNAYLSKEYKNVEFCFDAGQTVDQIEQTIKAVEDKRGKKVRFIVLDYNELVMTDKADPTASSAFVAQSMRKIAKQHNLCVLSLFQPSKISGSPADEITSYRATKGSSAIEQSLNTILGMSRPAYDPKNPSQDKFVTINCLKNRMGSLFSVDLHWDGLTGTVREMTQEEGYKLKDIIEKKKEEKEEKNGWV